MNRSLLWGALAGAATAYLATRPARVRVIAELDAEPEDLLKLVAQVEREPEFIPFVQNVQLEGREGDSVRYHVETCVGGIPGWARFYKRIQPNEGRAEWHTLEGMGGFQQRGRLTSEWRAGRAHTEIQTTTQFALPVLGPILSHLSRPFLAYAFARWLMNLEAALSDASERHESMRGEAAARIEG